MSVPHPELKLRDAFGLGSFRFRWEMLYVPVCSSIITGAIHAPIIHVFKHSRRSFDRSMMVMQIKVFKMRTRHILRLVLIFKNVAVDSIIYFRICLIVWISLCMTYLLTIGLAVPRTTAYVWMICTILSMIIYVVLIENIYLSLYYVLSLYFAKVIQNVNIL